MGCIGTLTGKYLANLEDVLDVYVQPTVTGVTRLCFDEQPYQLLDHVLSPIPAKLRGDPQKISGVPAQRRLQRATGA